MVQTSLRHVCGTKHAQTHLTDSLPATLTQFHHVRPTLRSTRNGILWSMFQTSKTPAYAAGVVLNFLFTWTLNSRKQPALRFGVGIKLKTQPKQSTVTISQSPATLFRSELRSCVKVEVAVPGSRASVPNKPTVSVDVKQHLKQPLVRGGYRDVDMTEQLR